MKMRIGGAAVPAGVYVARFDGGESVTTSIGEAYKLGFTIVGGEHDSRQVSRLLNPEANSPKSNKAIFFAALAGIPVEDGAEIDDDDFRGELYQILVGINANGYSRLEKIVKRFSAAANDAAPDSVEAEAAARF